MAEKTDNLMAHARHLQTMLNETLDELQALGVRCHSVASFPGWGDNSNRFMPLPLERVVLVLELQKKV